MRYRVSEIYLAERRGGPRRAYMALSGIFLLMTGLIYLQHDPAKTDSEFFGIFVMGIIMAAISLFIVRRTTKMTTALEKLVIAVSPNELNIESAYGNLTLQGNNILRITMYRTLVTPKVCFFVLKGRGGDAVIPPLENAEAFALEIRVAMPTVPFVSKRKLMVNFGG